jgi:hypothetical protein
MKKVTPKEMAWVRGDLHIQIEGDSDGDNEATLQNILEFCQHAIAEYGCNAVLKEHRDPYENSYETHWVYFQREETDREYENRLWLESMCEQRELEELARLKAKYEGK